MPSQTSAVVTFMAAGHRKGDVFLRVEETVTSIERKTVVSGVPEDTGGGARPRPIYEGTCQQSRKTLEIALRDTVASRLENKSRACFLVHVSVSH